MTMEELKQKIHEAIPKSSLACFEDTQIASVKECAKIAIDFSIEGLKESAKNIYKNRNNIINNSSFKLPEEIILEQINELKKQKEEL